MTGQPTGPAGLPRLLLGVGTEQQTVWMTTCASEAPDPTCGAGRRAS